MKYTLLTMVAILLALSKNTFGQMDWKASLSFFSARQDFYLEIQRGFFVHKRDLKKRHKLAARNKEIESPEPGWNRPLAVLYKIEHGDTLQVWKQRLPYETIDNPLAIISNDGAFTLIMLRGTATLLVYTQSGELIDEEQMKNVTRVTSSCLRGDYLTLDYQFEAAYFLKNNTHVLFEFTDKNGRPHRRIYNCGNGILSEVGTIPAY